MQPQPLGPADYEQIAQAMLYLVVFVALAINAGFALLLGWGILPSLIETADVSANVLRLRRALLPIGVISTALMVFALWRGLVLAADVASRIYPRGAV